MELCDERDVGLGRSALLEPFSRVSADCRSPSTDSSSSISTVVSSESFQ